MNLAVRLTRVKCNVKMSQGGVTQALHHVAVVLRKAVCIHLRYGDMVVELGQLFLLTLKRSTSPALILRELVIT